MRGDFLLWVVCGVAVRAWRSCVGGEGILRRREKFVEYARDVFSHGINAVILFHLLNDFAYGLRNVKLSLYEKNF